MDTQTTAATHKVQFTDLPDILRFLDTAPPLWRQRDSVNAPATDKWSLGHTFADCRRMAEQGWPEGIRQLSVAMATLPNGSLATHSYDVAGDHPDVPRYCAGDPFNMRKRGHSTSRRPTMTLVISSGGSSYITAQQTANYGAALCAVIDRLESQGVRLEVIGLWGSVLPFGRFTVSWHLKRCEDALDINAVAFGLAHPGMSRRIMFAVAERMPAHLEKPGYGRPLGTIFATDLVHATPGALYIGGIGTDKYACRNMRDALAFVTKQINQAAQANGVTEPVVQLEEA